MFDIKQFVSAIKQISEEKGIPEASVLETIEAAIAAAYKRDYGKKGQIIRAKFNADERSAQRIQPDFSLPSLNQLLPALEQINLARQAA